MVPKPPADWPCRDSCLQQRTIDPTSSTLRIMSRNQAVQQHMSKPAQCPSASLRFVEPAWHVVQSAPYGITDSVFRTERNNAHFGPPQRHKSSKHCASRRLPAPCYYKGDTCTDYSPLFFTQAMEAHRTCPKYSIIYIARVQRV
jgi:hypothetical protein